MNRLFLSTQARFSTITHRISIRTVERLATALVTVFAMLLTLALATESAGAQGFPDNGQATLATVILDHAANPHGTADDAQTITTFDVPNAKGTTPQGINLSGRIAGYYTDSTGGAHGFLRKHNGKITTFDGPPSSSRTFAYGINFFGEIVGTVQDLLTTNGFIRRRNGTIIEWNADGQSPVPARALTTPGQAGSNCVVDGAGALAINALGETTGSLGNGCTTGYLRQGDGTLIRFQVTGQLETVAPQAINLLGQITGWYQSNSTWDGFLRQPDGTILTFHVPNSTSVIPQGINFFGEIAGYYRDSSDSPVLHGFLRHRDGTFLTFDPVGSINTQVTAINDKGEITGSYATADGIYHGFVRNQQGVIESFDAVGSGNPGTFPKAINDLGQITGYYQDASFVLHGFVRGER